MPCEAAYEKLAFALAADFARYYDAHPAHLAHPRLYLKKIGYSGGISCECGWPNRKDKDAFYAARVKALAVMKKFAGPA